MVYLNAKQGVRTAPWYAEHYRDQYKVVALPDPIRAMFDLPTHAYLPKSAQKVIEGTALTKTDLINLPLLCCNARGQLKPEKQQHYVTPLQLAAFEGKAETCQILLTMGAYRDWMHTHQGRTAAFYALLGEANLDAQLSILKMLVTNTSHALYIIDRDGYSLTSICIAFNRLHDLEALFLTASTGNPTERLLDTLFHPASLEALAHTDYREEADRISHWLLSCATYHDGCVKDDRVAVCNTLRQKQGLPKFTASEIAAALPLTSPSYGPLKRVIYTSASWRAGAVLPDCLVGMSTLQKHFDGLPNDGKTPGILSHHLCIAAMRVADNKDALYVTQPFTANTALCQYDATCHIAPSFLQLSPTANVSVTQEGARLVIKTKRAILPGELLLLDLKELKQAWPACPWTAPTTHLHPLIDSLFNPAEQIAQHRAHYTVRNPVEAEWADKLSIFPLNLTGQAIAIPNVIYSMLSSNRLPRRMTNVNLPLYIGGLDGTTGEIAYPDQQACVTPLMVACFLGQTDWVEALLAAGADPQIQHRLDEHHTAVWYTDLNTSTPKTTRDAIIRQLRAQGATEKRKPAVRAQVALPAQQAMAALEVRETPAASSNGQGFCLVS